MKKALSSKPKKETKIKEISVPKKDFAEQATRWIGSKKSLKVHGIFFFACFLPPLFGAPLDTVLLFLTTVVSLEAIYLAIFIQLTVNKHSEELVEVAKDVDEIQEDIDEIQTDVDEIQEDIDEIQTDVDEIQEDVGEIQEDVDDIEEDTTDEQKRDKQQEDLLKTIYQKLDSLTEDLKKLKQKN